MILLCGESNGALFLNIKLFERNVNIVLILETWGNWLSFLLTCRGGIELGMLRLCKRT